MLHLTHQSSSFVCRISCVKQKKIRYIKSDWIHIWLSTMKNKTPLHKRVHRNKSLHSEMGSHNWEASHEIWFEFLFMLISQQIAAFWRLSFWGIKADRSKKIYNYIIGYLALATYQNICSRLQPLSIWSLNCFHHYINNMKQLRNILRLTTSTYFPIHWKHPKNS